MPPLLSVNNIEVIYDDVSLVLKGMSLSVEKGQIVAVLGANGAGKTTTLKAISGLLKTEEGEVTDGAIEFEGVKINGMDPEKIVRMGVFQVMEGRRVFEELTVRENLIAAAHTQKCNRKELDERIDQVYSFFPRLKERETGMAGYLSGGEQQMLVIGRGMMAKPKLMMLDEPSLGLSPLLVSEIFEIIVKLNRDLGTTILLVEQNARMALNIADHGYIMENGKIVLDDTTEKLKNNEDVKRFYLGITDMGTKRSYRDVKHYKRRKRWLT
jgi:branched-chain amino acid transport system ATP-binding protein